jgi:hypothetical protein
MKKTSQKGSAAAWIIFVLVAVVVVGAIVWYETYYVNRPPIVSVTSGASSQPAATSSSTAAMQVPGMLEYSDPSFGFSFWYPDGWQVISTPVQEPNKYPGGTIVKELDVENGMRQITLEEFTSPSSSITDSTGVGACPVCSTTNYYFNSANRTWMVVYPNGSNAGTPAPGVPSRANISTNTIGGLYMLAGSQRFGANVIVPLSPKNFVVVTVDGAIATGSNDAQALAKTIVASDPAAGTPVSAAVQVQTIGAETTAYANLPDLN